MFAILRADLNMTAGKAAAQAGHAFVESFEKAPPDVVAAYNADGGTKIVLTARDEPELRSLHEYAEAGGFPCALIVESNHVMLPTFDGSPIVTALGIGPVYRSQVKHITKGLALMK